MCFRPTVAAKKTIKCTKCGEVSPVPLSINSSMKDIMAIEAGKAIIEKHCQQLMADSRFKQAQGMSLKQMMPMSSGKITHSMIQKVSEELDQLPKPKCRSCGEEIQLSKGPAGPSGPVRP